MDAHFVRSCQRSSSNIPLTSGSHLPGARVVSPSCFVAIARSVAETVRDLGRVVAAIGVTLLLASCTTPQEFSVRLSSTGGYGARDIFEHIDNYSGHPLGTSRRKVDYQWKLFLGHGVERVQVHVANLRLGSESALKILNANGTVLQQFDSSSPETLWSEEFSANLLIFHLVGDLPAGSGKDQFTVDRLRTWLSVPQWFSNHPTSTLVGGAFPNIPALQPTTGDTRKRTNQEVWGLLGGRDAHYYVATGLVHHTFDFATITPPSGPPAERNMTTDTWYRAEDRALIAGRFGDDDRDDVAVLTNRGEVFVSLNTQTADGRAFKPYHLARRTFPTGGILRAGKMNADSWDDLITVSGATEEVGWQVTYALNNGNAAYPEFGTPQTVDLVWSGSGAEYAGIPAGTFIADFNGDGYADVAVLLNVGGEGATAWTVDHFQVFLNNQSGGFQGYRVHGYRGFANAPDGHTRQILVGDFDGNHFADLLLADYPTGANAFTLTNQTLAIQVSRNVLTGPDPSPVADGFNVFNSPRLWSTLPLAATSEGQEVVLRLAVADLNGDGRDDIVAFTGVRCKDCPMPQPSKVMVALSEEVDISSPLASGTVPQFGDWKDWTPVFTVVVPDLSGGLAKRIPVPFFVSMPNMSSLLSAGKFTGGDQKQVFVSAKDYSVLTRLLVMDTQLDASGNPVRFRGLTERRIGSRPQYALDDVDGDGRKDLVIFTADEQGNVEVLLNRSATTAASAYTFDRFQRSDHVWRTQFAKDFRPGREYPFVADVDGDGYPDLVLVSGEAPTWGGDGAFLPFGIFVSLNKRDGTFGPATRWGSWIAIALADGNRVPLVGDFDGDGRADLAIVAPASVGGTAVYVALSTGSQFGSTTYGYDWLLSTTINIDPAHDNTYAVVDLDGDKRSDILIKSTWQDDSFTRGNVRSVRMRPGGSHIVHHELGVNLRGNPRYNRVAAGRFAGHEWADLALYVSEAERAATDGNSLQVFFAMGETELTPFPFQRYQKAGPTNDDLVQVFAANLDQDKREELVLVRPGRAADSNGDPSPVALELQAVKMDYYDIDVHVRQQPATLSNGLPFDGWTSGSAHPGTGQELAFGRTSADGKFAVRVLNKSSEPVLYKLISNQVLQQDLALGILFMKPTGAVTDDFINRGVALMKDGARRLHDATDGYYRLAKLEMWSPEDPDDFAEFCDPDIDVQLFDQRGRADAAAGCRIRLHIQESDSATFVHEFGHYRFLMKDEYCENDNDAVGECPPPLTGSNASRPLCPSSLMAKSEKTEFCTLLQHNPFAITNTLGPRFVPTYPMNAAWFSIDMCPPMMCLFPSEIGPARPETTPNPHLYQEFMFNTFMRACAGDTGDCFVP